MAVVRRAVAAKKVMGTSLKIPKALHEKFATEMRFVRPEELVGLWPVNAKLLRDKVFMDKLLKDKAFFDNYEIAVVAKAR